MDNKGCTYVKNTTTVDRLTYVICSVANHMPVWERDAVIRGLEDEVERMKYRNYND